MQLPARRPSSPPITSCTGMQEPALPCYATLSLPVPQLLSLCQACQCSMEALPCCNAEHLSYFQHPELVITITTIIIINIHINVVTSVVLFAYM